MGHQPPPRFYTYGTLIHPGDHSYEEREYYGILAVLMDETEFRGNREKAASLGDLTRQPSKNHPASLFHLISTAVDTSKGTQESVADIDTYFIRIPGHHGNNATRVGLVLILLCAKTSDAMGSLSHRLSEMLRCGDDKAQSASKKASAAASSVIVVRCARDLRDVLNGCMHKRIKPEFHINPNQSFVSANLLSYRDHVVPDNDHLTAIAVQDASIHDHSIINPFISLNIHRILRSENILPAFPQAQFLCPDIEGGIFQGKSIRFSLLPAGCRAFEMSIAKLSVTQIFPDVLPDEGYLQTLIPCEVIQVTAAMTYTELCDAILEGRDTGVPEHPVFVNPMRYSEVPETQVAPDMEMRYLRDICSKMESLRKAGASEEEIKPHLIAAIEKAMSTMQCDVRDTPNGPRIIASELYRGLRAHGLHFLPPQRRSCVGESAYIGWILARFQEMGMLAHDVSVGMRMLLSHMTALISDNGGIQLVFTGIPSDGKTFSVTKVMSRVITSMVFLSSASKHAFDSSGSGVRLRYNCAAFDDVSPGLFTGLEQAYKILLAGSNKSARLRNNDFKDPSADDGDTDSGSSAAPCFVVMTSNYLLQDIVGTSESGSVTAGVNAFQSRMFNFRIPPHRDPFRDVSTLNEARLSDDEEMAVASQLRFFHACCSFIALLINHKIIHYARNTECTRLASSLIEALKTISGNTEPIDQRVSLHAQTLPVVAAIMSQVFERIVMGGEHKAAASAADLAEIFYDIANSLIPTVHSTVFGASLAMEGAISVSSHSSVLLEHLLQVVKPAMFNESHGNFIFDDDAQKRFMSLYTDGNNTKAFRHGSFKDAVKPLQQLRYDGFGTTADQRSITITADGAFVSRRLVLEATSKRSPVDVAITEYIKADGDDERNEYEFLHFFRELIKSCPTSSRSDLVDALLVRVMIGAIGTNVYELSRPGAKRPYTDRAAQQPTILSYVGARSIFDVAAQEPSPDDLHFRGFLIAFTRPYRDQLARSNPSVIIPGIVRRLVPIPGSYPLCIPSAGNVRSVEVVRVSTEEAAVARHSRQPLIFGVASAPRVDVDADDRDSYATRRAYIPPDCDPFHVGLFLHRLERFRPLDCQGRITEAEAAQMITHIGEFDNIRSVIVRNETHCREHGWQPRSLDDLMRRIGRMPDPGKTPSDFYRAIAHIWGSTADHMASGHAGAAAAAAAHAPPAALAAHAVPAAPAARGAYGFHAEGSAWSAASHLLAPQPPAEESAWSAASHLFAQQPPAVGAVAAPPQQPRRAPWEAPKAAKAAAPRRKPRAPSQVPSPAPSREGTPFGQRCTPPASSPRVPLRKYGVPVVQPPGSDDDDEGMLGKPLVVSGGRALPAREPMQPRGVGGAASVASSPPGSALPGVCASPAPADRGRSTSVSRYSPCDTPEGHPTKYHKPETE